MLRKYHKLKKINRMRMRQYNKNKMIIRKIINKQPVDTYRISLHKAEVRVVSWSHIMHTKEVP